MIWGLARVMFVPQIFSKGIAFFASSVDVSCLDQRREPLCKLTRLIRTQTPALWAPLLPAEAINEKRDRVCQRKESCWREEAAGAGADSRAARQHRRGRNQRSAWLMDERVSVRDYRSRGCVTLQASLNFGDGSQRDTTAPRARKLQMWLQDQNLGTPSSLSRTVVEHQRDGSKCSIQPLNFWHVVV